MNKLAAARVVLVALEKQEQKLLEQLCSVRVAARAQRAKVEKLIKRLPTLPIKRFPNELLRATRLQEMFGSRFSSLENPGTGLANPVVYDRGQTGQG